MKLQVKEFPARSIRETAEGKYWKQFKAPVFAKQVREGSTQQQHGRLGNSSSAWQATKADGRVVTDVCSLVLIHIGLHDSTTITAAVDMSSQHLRA